MRLKTGTSEELDRVIHERARLAIVAALASAEELSFAELRGITGLTDGNLSVQLRTLETAGYVAIRRAAGLRPRMEVRLTSAGRRAFKAYLGVLERMVGRLRR
jgi:DNA-binding MarR family transcriptional regulator